MPSSQDISQLQRDIILLNAEMKARSDKIDKYDANMKALRSNIMTYLQQSLADPLFETNSMSLLVMQLSLTLAEDEYQIGECGLATLKAESVFKDLSLNYETPEDEAVAKDNFLAFGKAVEAKLHVKMPGDRRLSLRGGRIASPKRKSSDDGKNGNDLKKHSTRLPAPSNLKKKVSPKRKEKMTLTQFQNSNDNKS